MPKSKLTFSLLPSLLLLLSFADAQTSNELNSKVILVRGPEYEQHCTKNNKARSVSSGNKNVSIDIGDEFQIVTHRRGISNIRVIEKCSPSKYFDNLYLFASRQYVDWEGDTDAMMAVKGASLTSDQAGSVAQIRLNLSQQAAVFDALRGNITASDTIIVQDGTIISPPNSIRLFLFVRAKHYNPINYLTAGDQTIASTGMVFEIRGSEMPLLILEPYLASVYSISDVDNDNIWEVLVQSGDWGGGIYEIRFFDGKQFKADRLQLYEWSH